MNRIICADLVGLVASCESFLHLKIKLIWHDVEGRKQLSRKNERRATNETRMRLKLAVFESLGLCITLINRVVD